MKCQVVHPDASLVSTTNAVLLTIAGAVILISNLIANGLLLYSMKKLRFLSPVSYKFILSLVICDICVALLSQPTTIAAMYMPHDDEIKVTSSSCMTRLFSEFFAFLLCECSGVLVMNITLDRYLHMKYLQNYNTKMTPYRANVLIVSAWVFSAIVAVIFVLASLYGFIFIYHTVILLVDLPIISANFFLYSRAFFTLRKRVNEMNLNATSRSSDRADLLFAKAVALILIVIIVCYSPYFAIQTAWLYISYMKNETPSPALSVASYWAILFIHSSSLCNPIILIFSNAESKTFIKDLCNRCTSVFCHRETPNEEVAKPSDYGSTVTISSVVLSRKFDHEESSQSSL